MGENKSSSNFVWIKEAHFLGTEVELGAPALAKEGGAGSLMHSQVSFHSKMEGAKRIIRAFGKFCGKH